VRLAAVVALVAGLLTWSVDAAEAKGPESGNLTGPGLSEPIELIAIDSFPVEWALVEQLMQQTGVWYATGDRPRSLEDKPEGELGPAYTLTWINDYRAGGSVDERTARQLIYPDADYGPLIHTQQVPQGWGPGLLGWFVAPSGLQDTMIELGVPIAAHPGPSISGALWYIAAAVAALLGASSVLDYGQRRTVLSRPQFPGFYPTGAPRIR
jgi:hypothetical protein